MTDRLADINLRINGILKLTSVVNAMRGIAAARAQQARAQLEAVDSYSEAIVDGISWLLPLLPDQPPRSTTGRNTTAVIIFLAEQGFAGAFGERVLGTVDDVGSAKFFIVGTRGSALARERGLTTSWACAMPPHSTGVPAMADSLAQALYSELATGQIDTLDVVFSTMKPGVTAKIVRKRLLPIELEGWQRSAEPPPPLLNLPADAVMAGLLADYIHAQLCNAALHSFAAESEARLAAMTSTRAHISEMLNDLQMTQRVARQEEITAEIIELAAGATTSRPKI